MPYDDGNNPPPVAPTATQRRVALVIGNGAYQYSSPLKNPPNDADAIATALKGIGFSLYNDKCHLDMDVNGLRLLFRDFSYETDGADAAMIYFAGHGIEFDGSNYLVPVEARLRRDRDVPDEAVHLDRAINAVNGAHNLKLIVLDSCRDNPFLDKLITTGTTRRVVARGLGREEPENNILIAYAAKHGSTASDGKSGAVNSPYTEALLKHMATPGLDIRILFGRVRDTVKTLTGDSQEPFTYGSLGGALVYLVPKIEEVKLGHTEEPFKSEAAIAFEHAKNSGSIAVLSAMEQHFPGSIWATLAAEECRNIEVRQKDEEKAALAKEQTRKIKEQKALLTKERVEKEDETAAAKAGQVNTIAAYKGYLNKYPSGRFVQWVNERLIPLQKKAEVRDKEGPWEFMVGLGSTSEKRLLKHEDTFQDAPFSPKMIVIEPGIFMMGSPDNEPKRSENEKQHEVTISKPFAMGCYPVTFDEWDAFTAEMSSHLPENQGEEDGGNRSVIDVSWKDVQGYIKWLNDKTDHVYRLPREAEWEYAARAGTMTAYSFGNKFSNSKAKYKGEGVTDGSCAANSFGLYDMHGNVSEWCSDYYGDYEKGSQTDPKGPGWGSSRVLRGGNWRNDSGRLRSANRNDTLPDTRNNALGFRLLREL